MRANVRASGVLVVSSGSPTSEHLRDRFAELLAARLVLEIACAGGVEMKTHVGWTLAVGRALHLREARADVLRRLLERTDDARIFHLLERDHLSSDGDRDAYREGHPGNLAQGAGFGGAERTRPKCHLVDRARERVTD